MWYIIIQSVLNAPVQLQQRRRHVWRDDFPRSKTRRAEVVTVMMSVNLQMTRCNSPAVRLPVPAADGLRSQCRRDVVSVAVGKDGRSRLSWRCVASSTARIDEVLMMTAWLSWNPLGPSSQCRWAWQGLPWSWTRYLQFCPHSAAGDAIYTRNRCQRHTVTGAIVAELCRWVCSSRSILCHRHICVSEHCVDR